MLLSKGKWVSKGYFLQLHEKHIRMITLSAQFSTSYVENIKQFDINSEEYIHIFRGHSARISTLFFIFRL